MQNYQKLVDYFKDFIDMISPENKALVVEAYKLVDDNFWTVPAASGDHHNELQACEHGLLYHIYEGLIALDQFIRARKDVMDRYRENKDYEGSTPESDLITAYLMHDICKYKSDPSGSNYRHDEDGYIFCKKLGFNPVVCEIVRYTHGQWATAVKTAPLSTCKYLGLVWLSHYADMAASTTRTMKFIENVKTFDKVYFQNNKVKKKAGDKTVDTEWWSKAKPVGKTNDIRENENEYEEQVSYY